MARTNFQNLQQDVFTSGATVPRQMVRVGGPGRGVPGRGIGNGPYTKTPGKSHNLIHFTIRLQCGKPPGKKSFTSFECILIKSFLS